MKSLFRMLPFFTLAVVCLAGAPRALAQIPSLPGTHWELLSLTGKNEKITDAQNPADVEFLKDSKWGILHYGGRREAGTYTLKGDRLVMKTEDGAEYMDAKVTWKPDSKMLELQSTDYLMRLRVSKLK